MGTPPTPRPASLRSFRTASRTSTLTVVARHVLCLVGIHNWVQLRNDDGEPYIECGRCGQYREQERPGGDVPPSM